MTLRHSTLLALALAACTSSDEPALETGESGDPVVDTDDSGDTDSGTDTEETGDTGPNLVTGAAGELLLTEYLADADYDREVQLVGNFADSMQGFVNGAECMVLGSCRTAWPAATGDVVLNDPGDAFDTYEDPLIFVGDRVILGDFEADFSEDPFWGTSYYFGRGVVPWPTGALGLSNTPGGRFGDINVPDALTLPASLETTSPAVDARLEVLSNAEIALEWTPGTGADLFLDVRGYDFFATIRLADNGGYTLDLGGLGIPEEEDELALTLMRQTSASVDWNGNAVTLAARSQQSWYASLTNVGDRLPIDPAASCSEAASAEPLEDGGFYGFFGSTTGALDPSCLDRSGAGPEGIVPVTVKAGELLDVLYTVPGGSAAAYLLTDCADASECIADAEATYAGDTARLVWFNQGDDATVHLVLDRLEEADGVFLVDVERRSVTATTAVDTCEALDGADLTAPGFYYVDTSALADDLDAADCVGWETPGPEGFLKVEVPPSHRLNVNYELIGGDSALVLFDACAPIEDCVADDYGFSAETDVTWPNVGTEAATILVALDNTGDGGPGFVEIEVNEMKLPPVADTCADAASLPLIEAGTYEGTVATYANDADPGSNGCTGFAATGKDAIGRVEVPAGKTVRVSYTQFDDDASVYLVEDCAAAATTCLTGDDATYSGQAEVISWKNTGSAPETLFLVLDAYLDGADYSLEVSFE